MATYQELYDNIVSIKNKYSDEILSIEGVHGIGVNVETQTIIVSAHDITPENLLRIPTQLDGFIVECEGRTQPKALSTAQEDYALQYFRPLGPGTSIARQYNGETGTMTGIFWSETLQQNVGHSNHHVLSAYNQGFKRQDTNNTVDFTVLAGGTPYTGADFDDYFTLYWRNKPTEYQGNPSYQYGYPNGTAHINSVAPGAGMTGAVITITAQLFSSRRGRCKVLFNNTEAKVKSWTSTYDSTAKKYTSTIEVYVPEMAPGDVPTKINVEGESIHSPSPYEAQGWKIGDVIGNLEDFAWLNSSNYLDSAIFTFHPSVPIKSEYIMRAAINDSSYNFVNSPENLGCAFPGREYRNQGVYPGPIYAGMPVMKTGRTTGTTFGIIQSVSKDSQYFVPGDGASGTVTLKDCIETVAHQFVNPLPTDDEGQYFTNLDLQSRRVSFMEAGDSGSGIFTATYEDYAAWCDFYGIEKLPKSEQPEAPPGYLIALGTYGAEAGAGIGGGSKAHYFMDYYGLSLDRLPMEIAGERASTGTALSVSLSSEWSIAPVITSITTFDVTIHLGVLEIGAVSAIDVVALVEININSYMDLTASMSSKSNVLAVLQVATVFMAPDIDLESFTPASDLSFIGFTMVGYSKTLNAEVCINILPVSATLEIHKVEVVQLGSSRTLYTLPVSAKMQIISAAAAPIQIGTNRSIKPNVQIGLAINVKLLPVFLSRTSREFEFRATINGVTYDKTDVINFDIEDSLIPSEEFVLGSVISSKLTLSVRTSNTIPSNASISPSFRLSGPEGVTDWVPLGVYYIDTRGYQNNVWTFSCFDKLILSQQTYVSALTYPTTMANVFDELCGQLGLTADNSVSINPTYMIPYHDLDITMRDMLGYIASAHGASALLTKNSERIAFVKFAAGATVKSITASDYFRVQQTNPLKTFTAIKLTYNTDGETLTAGSGDEDHTLNIYNPFMDQSMLNAVFAGMNGFSYMPFTMDWKGDPTLDLGAPITVTERDGSTFSSVILSNKASYKGGLKATITSPSYSAQRSETDYKGSLKQFVNSQLGKTLQPDVPYYGVTIGRANGLKIARSDGVSTATFNSDKLEIDRNGSPVFKVNSSGYVELTGVVVNGGSITWGYGGVNPPTAAQVGVDLSNYITSGTLSSTLTSYLTNSQLTTKLGQDYIVTGKIAANQIATGTLTGFTIQTATSGSRLVLNSSNMTGYDSSGNTSVRLSNSSMEFWGSGANYAGKVYGSGYSMRYDATTAHIFYVSSSQVFNLGSYGSTSYLFTDLNMSGKVTASRFYGDVYTSKITPSSGTVLYVGNYGCNFNNTSDGAMRLASGSGSYLLMTGSSLVFYRSNGTSITLS